MSSQFLKLAVLTLSMGACAIALLALRQQRLQIANELARTQLRLRTLDERLWALRADVAELITPDRIHELASGLGDLRPIVAATPDFGAPESPTVAPGTKPANPPAEKRRTTADPDRERLAFERVPR